MAKPQPPHGFHMVGSVPPSLKSTEEVFRYVCSKLPAKCMARIPDGETGIRSMFTTWQFGLFPPEAQPTFGAKPPAEPTQAEIDMVVANLNPIETGYDNAAINSYVIFTKLKREGVIPTTMKFQVSIPSPIGTIICLEPAYRAALEPAYEDAILRTLVNLQAKIPAHDLAIQIDVAVELGLIEGFDGAPWLSPYWEGDQFEGVLKRLLRLVQKVNPEVDLGFHLCYGDIGHKHWMEPKDTAAMVKLATALLEQSPHQVTWIHMPVPKDRDDVEYFEPLTRLHLGETKLFLGLVHPYDEEGTERRIAAAKRLGVLADFGVATECGMGRTPEGELDEIFRVAKAVTMPYPQISGEIGSVTPDTQVGKTPESKATSSNSQVSKEPEAVSLTPQISKETKASWRKSLTKRFSIFRSSK